jgi:type I restriction enzyme M protein
MLDSDTKRRINTCRDILVGKVPDPKSQVEQITIAMIYKFMDDMDLEAEEMGGTRKFFTGDFERYAWAKLVAPGVGGQEMLNTYAEALQKMPENAGIPALFRDIFRNAYLPYRDPETLRSFLREINGFSYDNSERLGDAFEYLLSVLGSQGDAGQFRTPRHIIDFMVEIVDPKKGEIILDPACGTAGFLISSYKHILKTNSTEVATSNGSTVTDVADLALESPLRFKGDLLTPEDRTRLATNVRGYDISPDMVRLSLVNLYLHGFADPKVEEYDTLTSDDKWTEMADVILANPPFMSPKGGIKPHNRFQVPSKRSEVLFVDYIAEHLTPQGRAAIIVPEGIIFQSQSAYCALRKLLVDKYLVAVVSLPAGVFNPYSGVKTSILILDRAAAKSTDSIAFFKIENDGFGLGAQRRAVKGGQLGQVKADLSAWLAAVRSRGDGALHSPLGFLVEKQRIANGGDYNLSGERYQDTVLRQSSYPLVALGDLLEVQNGFAFKADQFGTSEGMPIIRIRDIKPSRTETTYSGQYDESYLVYDGDLLIGMDGEFNSTIWSGGQALLNQRVCKLHSFDKVLRGYVARLLPAKLKEIEDATYAVTVKHISAKQIREIEIPLPPLEVQREIVAEIEGYQKVVDGARAVLENYRPHIPIDPTWPIETIDAIADLKYGFTASASETGDARFVRITDVDAEGKLRAQDLKFITLTEESRNYLLHQGDILVARTGATFGKTMLFDEPYAA